MKSFFNHYKYILIAQLYWPIWSILSVFGYPVIGIASGSVVVFAGWAIAWYGFDSKEYK